MNANVARVLGESVPGEQDGPDGSTNPFPPPGRSYPEIPPKGGAGSPDQEPSWEVWLKRQYDSFNPDDPEERAAMAMLAVVEIRLKRLGII